MMVRTGANSIRFSGIDRDQNALVLECRDASSVFSKPIYKRPEFLFGIHTDFPDVTPMCLSSNFMGGPPKLSEDLPVFRILTSPCLIIGLLRVS